MESRAISKTIVAGVNEFAFNFWSRILEIGDDNDVANLPKLISSQDVLQILVLSFKGQTHLPFNKTLLLLHDKQVFRLQVEQSIGHY